MKFISRSRKEIDCARWCADAANAIRATEKTYTTTIDDDDGVDGKETEEEEEAAAGSNGAHTRALTQMNE